MARIEGSDTYEMIYRLGSPPEEGLYPGRARSTRREHGLLVERDVPVEMRDGVRLLVDVFRPIDATDLPTLLSYSPYGKHVRKSFQMYSGAGQHEVGRVAGEQAVPRHLNMYSDDMYSDDGRPVGVMPYADVKTELSHYTLWEGPDPLFWCANGYTVVNADARGSWESEGTLTFQTRTEALDGYDLVEWAARQGWSNGRVGMTGVSYLAWSQWNVAATQPPHLCAINPWEGYSDPYRDFCMHGGMRETRFRSWWIESTAYSRTRVEDVIEMGKRHPFLDQYWIDRTPDLSRIEVPLYAVVDWGDHGIHTRGTIEGFKQVSSREKWLEVHGRFKWPYFYRPESLDKQLRFFNTFLKGEQGLVSDWTRVSIEVRESYLVGKMRGESAWPVERTEYRQLFLDAEKGSLSPTAPLEARTASYDCEVAGACARFRYVFPEDTELTGNMCLSVWVEALGGNDMDLFVAVEKLDEHGERVGFPLQSKFANGPVALGWLRASHRELDQKRSTPWQPWHLHERELPLPVGEPFSVDVEILPSSTLFKAGETLELLIAGRELFIYPGDVSVMEHVDTVNVGVHRIHTGGECTSYLLVPVVPEEKVAEEADIGRP